MPHWPRAMPARLSALALLVPRRFSEIACGLGFHDRVLSRMHALAAVEPLNERVHARLMIALAGKAQAALAKLCDEHLLTEHAPGRYACHELLRAYAAEAVSTLWVPNMLS